MMTTLFLLRDVALMVTVLAVLKVVAHASQVSTKIVASNVELKTNVKMLHIGSTTQIISARFHLGNPVIKIAVVNIVCHQIHVYRTKIACRVLVVVVGSELEVNILAFADLLEVGFLVSGDVVAKQVEGRQCPDGGKAISTKGRKWVMFSSQTLRCA